MLKLVEIFITIEITV